MRASAAMTSEVRVTLACLQVITTKLLITLCQAALCRIKTCLCTLQCLEVTPVNSNLHARRCQMQPEHAVRRRGQTYAFAPAGTDSDQPQGGSPGVLSPPPFLEEEPPHAAAAHFAEPSAAAAAVNAEVGGAVASPLLAQRVDLEGVVASAAGAAAGAPGVAASAGNDGGSLDAAAAVQMLTVSAQAAAPPAVRSNCIIAVRSFQCAMTNQAAKRAAR